MSLQITCICVSVEMSDIMLLCYSKESFEIGLHISHHENVMLFYFPNYELPAVVPTALNKGISIMR